MHTYVSLYIYNGIFLKHEILPFATTWMNLEGIMLTEISQRKTNTVYYNICGLLKKKTNE